MHIYFFVFLIHHYFRISFHARWFDFKETITETVLRETPLYHHVMRSEISLVCVILFVIQTIGSAQGKQVFMIIRTRIYDCFLNVDTE